MRGGGAVGGAETVSVTAGRRRASGKMSPGRYRNNCSALTSSARLGGSQKVVAEPRDRIETYPVTIEEKITWIWIVNHFTFGGIKAIEPFVYNRSDFPA
jgi:hypothetical protein